jgi:hypothetical protein
VRVLLNELALEGRWNENSRRDLGCGSSASMKTVSSPVEI